MKDSPNSPAKPIGRVMTGLDGRQWMVMNKGFEVKLTDSQREEMKDQLDENDQSNTKKLSKSIQRKLKRRLNNAREYRLTWVPLP